MSASGSLVVPNSKGFEISLGLKGGDHATSLSTGTTLLERFSGKVGAPHFAKWDGYSPVLAADTVKGLLPFIEKNLHSANKIHFNMDGFKAKSYSKFVNKFKGTLDGRPAKVADVNVTNWEFHQIVNSKDLLGKTTFYGDGGKVLSAKEIADIVNKANRSGKR